MRQSGSMGEEFYLLEVIIFLFIPQFIVNHIFIVSEYLRHKNILFLQWAMKKLYVSEGLFLLLGNIHHLKINK